MRDNSIFPQRLIKTRFAVNESGEFLMLLVPLIFICVCLGDFLWSMRLPTLYEHLATFLISSALFNVVHVGFTFYSIARVEELRGFFVRHYGSWNGFLWRAWGIGIVFFALSFLAYEGLRFGFANPIVPLATFFVIHGIINSWHALQQSKGLFLCYNHVQSSDDVPRSILKRERILLGVFVGSLMTYITLQEAPDSWLPKVQLALSALLLLSSGLALVLLVTSFISRPRINLRQLLFSSRFLLWMLIPVSQFSSMGIKACHGTEYYFVMEKINANQRWKKPWRLFHFANVFLILAVTHSVVTYNSGVPLLLYTERDQVPMIFNIINALGLALTYVHFYFDGVMFAFKNAEARATIGALLKNKLPAPAPTLHRPSPKLGEVAEQGRDVFSA
jgi:hypothetical protein